MSRLGEVIKEIRRAAELSRDELAARAAISAPFLTKIEQNRRRPSRQSLQRIAEALDVTTQDLTARAALWEASDAPTEEEMSRRLLRAAAVEGAVVTSVVPMIGVLTALVGPAAGLAAGAVAKEAAKAAQHRKRQDSSQVPPSSGAVKPLSVGPGELRQELIYRLNAMTNEQLAALAALIQEAERRCEGSSPTEPHGPGGPS
ncbi:helix-turn-helix domain-containing protein [Streptomyces sp. NPDC059979]|uniref:helix-turn-helix domain-containing protein n=1 Tax=Streptomyces sp. NPDC059979 TaxID=3347021 RepID=UPI0036C8703D